MTRNSLTVAVVVLTASPVAAQSTPAVLDSAFAQWSSTQGPGCTVGVDLAGTRTTRAYGMANLEYGVPLRAESVVESGSVAKQFTSAAMALLALRGRLSLDDDIRRHLPAVPDFGTPIRIRSFPPGSEVHTLARILDLVQHQQRLNFTTGDEYLYSNAGEYRSPELEVTYRIEAEGANLVLLSRPDDRLSFQPAYRDGFRRGGQTIRFMRDPKGRVTGFRVFAGRVRDLRTRSRRYLSPPIRVTLNGWPAPSGS